MCVCVCVAVGSNGIKPTNERSNKVHRIDRSIKIAAVPRVVEAGRAHRNSLSRSFLLACLLALHLPCGHMRIQTDCHCHYSELNMRPRPVGRPQQSTGGGPPLPL